MALQQGLDKDNFENKTAYRKRSEDEKASLVEKVPPRGHGDTKDLKKEASWKWHTKGDLKRETKSLLIAVQDQALNTNSVRKTIYQQELSGKCRLCRERVENVTHIVSSCKKVTRDGMTRYVKIFFGVYVSTNRKPDLWRAVKLILIMK